MKARQNFLFAITAIALLGLLRVSYAGHAGLNAVDPGPYTIAHGNFPVWYSDTDGLALELCLSAADAGNGPLCLIPPGFTTPFSFPFNFPDESFWFNAGADFANPTTAAIGDPQGCVKVIEFALEAAFAAGGVVDGDQIAFSRLRIRTNVPTAGTYTVTHPFGVETFEVANAAGGCGGGGGGGFIINMTRDVGIGAPGDFTRALQGDVGPFLMRSAGPIIVGTEQFIGDPNVATTVTGSQFGADRNKVTLARVTATGSVVIAETDTFLLAGKIYAGNTPSPLAIPRSSYSRSAAETQVDVFAQSGNNATVSFGPPAAAMFGDSAGHFFGQATQDPGSLIQTPVTVSADNSATYPGNTPTALASDVTDVVTITRAEFDPLTGTLLIEAVSSDELSPPPALTATGVGALTLTGPGLTQSISVSGLSIAPATVTVTSGESGSDTEEVVILP